MSNIYGIGKKVLVRISTPGYGGGPPGTAWKYRFKSAVQVYQFEK